MAHGDELVRPFVTHHAAVEHSIRMMGNEPWLFFRHSDGQWVTECPVSGPAVASQLLDVMKQTRWFLMTKARKDPEERKIVDALTDAIYSQEVTP